MALGKQIRHYRNKAGWKLKQLSEACDVDVGTISALENRDSTRSEFFAPIAKAFGLTLEQLADESISHDISSAITKDNPKKLPVDPDAAVLSRLKIMEKAPEGQTPWQYDEWTSEAIRIMMNLPDFDKRGAVANLKTYVHNLEPPLDQIAPANNNHTGTHHAQPGFG